MSPFEKIALSACMERHFQRGVLFLCGTPGHIRSEEFSTNYENDPRSDEIGYCESSDEGSTA